MRSEGGEARSETGPAPVYLLTPTRQDLRHVVRHMRPLDWHETACLYTEEITRDGLADGIYAMRNRYLVARVASGAPWTPPDAFIGLMGMEGTGLALAHMFATRNFARVARGLTGYVADELTPMMLELGVTRVEVRAWAENRPAIRWLRRLGAVEECLLPGFGRNGETFVQFAWRKADVLRTGCEIAAADG